MFFFRHKVLLTTFNFFFLESYMVGFYHVKQVDYIFINRIAYCLYGLEKNILLVILQFIFPIQIYIVFFLSCKKKHLLNYYKLGWNSNQGFTLS